MMSPETFILTIHSPENRRVDDVSRDGLINRILADFNLVGRVYVSRDPFKASVPILASKSEIEYVADLYLTAHGIEYEIG